jgi:phosphopantetheine--protein transferase-like protein
MATSARKLTGIGCDTEDLARFRQTIERSPGFIKRWYSAAEREEQQEASDPLYHALCQFTLKEALIKACWELKALTPSSIEVLLNEKPRLPKELDAVLSVDWTLHRHADYAEAEVLVFRN